MKTLKISLLILWCCATMVYSASADQRTSIDSLHQYLAEALPVQKPAVLHQLFKAFMGTNIDSALYYASRSLQAAVQQKDSLGMVRAYRARGYTQVSKGEIELGITDMERGLAIAEKEAFQDTLIRLYLLNDLATANIKEAHFDQGLAYFFKYLTEAEEQGDKISMSIALNNIGVTYFELGDYNNALVYYQRAHQMNHKDIDFNHRASEKLNIGECYSKLGKYPKSLAILQKVMADCAKEECSADLRAIIHITLGQVYFAKGERQAAKRALEEGLVLARSAGITDQTCTALRTLGKLALQGGQLAKAIDLLGQSQEIARSTDLKIEEMKNHKVYAKAYTKLGKYKVAAYHWQKYNEGYSQIFNSRQIQNIAKSQTQYEERRNLKQIENQKRIVNLREETLKIRKEQISTASTIIAVILIALMIMMLIYYQKARANVEITSQKIKLESVNGVLGKKVVTRTQELDKSNGLLKRVNRELKHIMNKISHDIRGPVATIKGMCTLSLYELKDPVALQYFKMTEDTANTLDVILTRLQHAMEINNAAVNMESINLLNVIERAWVSVRENRKLRGQEAVPKSLKVNYVIEEDLSVNSSDHMVKVILESLLDNTVKFRDTSKRKKSFVKISAKKMENHTEIRVADNGIGIPEHLRKAVFDLFVRGNDRVPNTGGMGLYVASMAARRIGANMMLGVDEEGCTELLLTIPENFTPTPPPVLEEEEQEAT